ncbi:MAG: methyltransferase domain-containing protein [Deltaproteobacteria bacterium]|nr:MAG: methyltransferase domain-containing protein [Deltaproteobacteria bacterium]
MVEGEVLEEVRGFLKSRIILTAAELDLFTLLELQGASAEDLSKDLECDKRALTRLLDCLVVLRLLSKEDGTYSTTERGELLSSKHPRTELPMVLHMSGLWQMWGGLTETVRTGKNPERKPISERGKDSLKAFINAMHVVGRTLSREIADSYNLEPFRRLLDIGGATGTYTMAFLEKNPNMTAVLFDLPDVIPMANDRLEEEGLLDRVELVAGDFYEADLPAGCDLALLSAIIHQNSPEQNIDLYRKIHQALVPGGKVLIRDHVMDADRTHPPQGAFFAINMLVNTEGGDTYTFDDIKEALEAAGFVEVKMVRKGEHMDCLVEARRPD